MPRLIGHLLNQTAGVHRVQLASDGMGGYTEDWTLVATVPARLSQPSPAARDAADRGTARVTHDVYLRPDADVRRGDRIDVRDLTLRVLSVVEPSEAIYRKAECTSDQHEHSAAAGT